MAIVESWKACSERGNVCMQVRVERELVQGISRGMRQRIRKGKLTAMDSMRGRKALYACLAAVSCSSTAYAFAPAVHHVTALASVREGAGAGGGGGREGGGRSVASRPTHRHSSTVGSGGTPGVTSSDGTIRAGAGAGEPAVAATAAGLLVGIKADGNGGGGGGGGGGGAGGKRSPYFGSRPAMALGQASQGQEGGGVTSTILALANRTERGQRLRALNWVKQVRNELTSAVFALNLNGARSGSKDIGSGGGGGGGGGEDSLNAVRRAAGGTAAVGRGGGSVAAGKGEIDYDSIAERLEASLRTLQAGRPLSLLEAISQDELHELTERLKSNLTKIKKITQAEGRSRGAGAVESKDVVKGGEAGEEGSSSWRDAGGILDGVTRDINVNLKDVKVPEFDLFVRDDGTVDWDGAIQSGREVARFGQELWDRINGQNPHEEGGLVVGSSHGGGEKPAKEIPEDSPVMQGLGVVGAELESRREQLQRELDALKADARAQEASWEGLDRRNAQRRIRDKEGKLSNSKKQLQLHRIDVDMERICYVMEQEIRESTTTSSSEYRLLVAEFGLLDAQLSNLKMVVAGLTGAEVQGVGEDGVDGLVIDEDELELVSREVLDLKNRLGMDLENPALTLDPAKVTIYVKDTYDKIKSGLDFYWTGTKILGNDIGYALTLVSKAVQGTTLKPREVRTLRRTGKDCVTFVPFVIILITPLSPVGHVLVFSFIQRFFPDFFPSTYTDRRQNLLKMYTEVEKKVDWEDAEGTGESGDGGEDMLETLRRNFITTLNQAGDQKKSENQKDR